MKQEWRISIYLILILAVVYTLVLFVPFTWNPSNWQLRSDEQITIADLDTLDLDSSMIKPDTIVAEVIIEDTIAEIDTVTTYLHLSCSTAFSKQLDKLQQTLLSSTTEGRNIRILHIGDSQIEGDRITAYLRESFQQRFGGSGPGLATIYDPQKINPSIYIINKGDWKIHSIFNRKYRLPNHEYGIMGQAASLKANSPGTFKISGSRWAEKHASYYQKVRLFIAPHKQTLQIKGLIDDTEVINDSLAPSDALTEINWEFEQLSPQIKFDISSNGDVHFLACALDSLCGVSVDNIALRGQSSPLLHRTNADLFKAMGEHLDIGMIIFQFGTNILPTIAPNYHFYKVQLAKQFKLIKSLLPDVPVIIIGISDAAHVNNGQIEAYDHLSRIRDAQKAIALEYDFAFFDLFEAMGGKGSIIEWANEDPPLALSDYIHFSRRGGKEVAGYLTEAIWLRFDGGIDNDSINAKNILQ